MRFQRVKSVRFWFPLVNGVKTMSLKRTIAMLLLAAAFPFTSPAQDAKTALNEQFWEAVRKGDLAEVTKLLDKGADVNATASPVASDGKVYLTSEDGEIFVFKAGPKHELLSVNPMGEVLMATPAISDGMLIVRGLKHVFGITESVQLQTKASK